MEYSVDISEIIAFIDSTLSFEKEDINECVQYFTEFVNEQFVDERANCVKTELESNELLVKAFRRLAYHCNGEFEHCQCCPVNKYCNHYINEVRANAKSGLHIIDLFCGAGGLSLGFTQEGFVTALANDIEPCCVDTYAHNHPETLRSNIVMGDINDLVENIFDYLKDTKIDVVIGGPPCQGFSMANRQRLIDDPRNYLYKSYVEIVNKVKPKFFIMENVKGMLGVAEQVKEDFEKIGYEVEYHLLNAKDYGVPQNRERLIYIGNNIDISNREVFESIFEKSKTIPDTCLEDALFGLRELEASKIKNATEIESVKSGFKIERNNSNETNGYIDYINQNRFIPYTCNHKARYNNERDIEIFGRMEPGDKSDDPKIADIMPYKTRNDIFKDKYYKLIPDKVCKTITAHMKFDCNMYIHPYQARGLTPREAARVQSYPDDYFFRGAYTKTYMQIGNSVPPLLGRTLAEVIKDYLSEEKL